MPPKDDNWSEWSHHVLKELKRLNDWIASVDGKLDKFQLEMVREITALKVKAGIWGLVGGAIPVAIGIAIWLFYHLKAQ